MAGAGGWGDPLRRDPARVLHDVREEKLTAAYAEREYGVVIDEAAASSTRRTAELRGDARPPELSDRADRSGQPVRDRRVAATARLQANAGSQRSAGAVERGP